MAELNSTDFNESYFYSRQQEFDSNINKSELLYIPPIRCFTCSRPMKTKQFKQELKKIMALKDDNKIDEDDVINETFKKMTQLGIRYGNCCKLIYMSDPTLEYNKFSDTIMKSESSDKRVFALLEDYFKNNSLCKVQIDSYNYFMERDIAKLISKHIISNREGAINKYRLKFNNVHMEKPSIIINIFEKTYDSVQTNISNILNQNKLGLSDDIDTFIGRIITLLNTEVNILLSEDMKDMGGLLSIKCLHKWITLNSSSSNTLFHSNRNILISKLIELKRTERKELNLPMNTLDLNEFIKKTPLYPKDALLNQMTYESRVMCDIEYINNYNNITIKNFELFRFPCMINSKLCNLYQLPKEDIIKRGGCPLDGGGYFILKNGLEYVIASQIRNAPNVLQVFNNQKTLSDMNDIGIDENDIKLIDSDKNIDKRSFVCRISSAYEDQNISFVNEITWGYDKNNTIECNVKFLLRRGIYMESSLKSFLNVFKKLSGHEIILSNIIDTKNKKIMNYIESLNNDNNIEDDMTEFMKKYNEMTLDQLTKKICHNLFPHLGADVASFKTKEFIELMIYRLLSTILKRRPLDQKDHYAFKRVDTAGTLCREIIDKRYNKMINKINKKMIDLFNKASGIFMNEYTLIKLFDFSDELTDDLLYPFITGNWGSSKQDPYMRIGVSQQMDNRSYFSRLGHMRKLSIPIAGTNKDIAVRKIHTSTFGFICPTDSPDGGNIGVILHFALMSLVTQMQSIESITNILTKCKSFQTEKKNINTNNYSLVIVNSRIIGYTTDQTDFLNFFYKKRDEKLLKSCSINISNDIGNNHNEIIIYSDRGRFIRPFFAVDKKNQLLMINNNDNKDITTWDKLIQNNSIKYLDPFEINNLYIARKPSNIDKNNDYSEIHPCLMFGIAGNVIPFPEHIPTPRVCFQSGMTKQAIGNPFLNSFHRFDNLTRQLQYPQRPIVGSRIGRFLGYDDLPSGQNVNVAILSMNWNQEDSIIINEGALQRGLFMSVTSRTVRVIENKDENLYYDKAPSSFAPDHSIRFPKRQKICNPLDIKSCFPNDDIKQVRPKTVFDKYLRKQPANYSKLDSNGIILPFKYIVNPKYDESIVESNQYMDINKLIQSPNKKFYMMVKINKLIIYEGTLPPSKSHKIVNQQAISLKKQIVPSFWNVHSNCIQFYNKKKQVISETNGCDGKNNTTNIGVLHDTGIFTIHELDSKNINKTINVKNLINFMGKQKDQKLLFSTLDTDIDLYKKERTWVEPNDVLVGMVEYDASSKKETMVDISITAKTKEYGYIEKIKIISHPVTSNKTIMIQISHVDSMVKHKISHTSYVSAEIGDKFAARAAQKGVVGLVVPQEDMPFDPMTGTSPDIIINPHALPSRMTINMLMEILTGKASLLEGTFTDATAFSSANKLDNLFKLLDTAGFHTYGTEKSKGYSTFKGGVLTNLTDGITGKPIAAKVYTGPCYYQRLAHLSSEKMYARRKGEDPISGPYTQDLRQPNDGRSRHGGIRIGEQERDCLLAHGASCSLNDRLYENSDPFRMFVCDYCGNFVTYKGETKCTYCNKGVYHLVNIPYASKQFIIDLMSMGQKIQLVLKQKPNQEICHAIQEDISSDITINTILMDEADEDYEYDNNEDDGNGYGGDEKVVSTKDKKYITPDFSGIKSILHETIEQKNTNVFHYHNNDVKLTVQMKYSAPYFIDIIDINLDEPRINIQFTQALIQYANTNYEKYIRIENRSSILNTLGVFFQKTNIMTEKEHYYTQNIQTLSESKYNNVNWLCYRCTKPNSFSDNSCSNCGKTKYIKQVLSDTDFLETISSNKTYNFSELIETGKQTPTHVIKPSQLEWSLLSPKKESVYNTFEYIYTKMKKGIYVSILNNKIQHFIPFSNVNFKNNWYKQLDKSNVKNIIEKSSELAGYPVKITNRNKITPITKWHTYNCLLQYLKTKPELLINDDRYNYIEHMLLAMCENMKVEDKHFFVNIHDFPMFKTDDFKNSNLYEPYEEIFGNEVLLKNTKSHYAPILSSVYNNNIKKTCDLPIPTIDCWKTRHELDNLQDWFSKKEIALFRGSSTGCGVTINTNVRLKLAQISLQNPTYIDARITKWNYRPRFNNGKLTMYDMKEINKLLIDTKNVIVTLPSDMYKNTMDKKNISYQFTDNTELFITFNATILSDKWGKMALLCQNIELKNIPKKYTKSIHYLDTKQQKEYKYIINVDGNVSAFRLSKELGMGSLILKADSNYKMWYDTVLTGYSTDSKKQVTNEHFIKVKHDLSNLIEVIEWCRTNDNQCKQIVQNALKFKKSMLSEKSMINYFSSLINKM